jgi:probable HAF family extracellular repeat protein
MTKYRSIYRTILLSALVTCTGIRDAAAAATPAYIVTDLGTLGRTTSYGNGINASGQVTGFVGTPEDNNIRGFLWNPTTPNGPSGTMIDLGTLGGAYSIGYGINASGQVTGDSDGYAFLYDGTMHDLGTLGGTSSYGIGINDSGQVTGVSSTIGDAVDHAFLYDGAMNDLGTLGGTDSYGNAINNRGQLTGYSQTTGDAADHAFLYDVTMNDLGTLGGTDSYGHAINETGQVTGQSYTIGDAAYHAFLYDGTMHDLGTLGGTDSYGIGINNNGEVTGYSQTTADATYHAFLYASGSGMVDLNTLIDPFSGWELLFGRGINDAGQITGQGVIGGERHAFLLTPVPEPSGFALLALALPLIVWRNSRQLGTGGTCGVHGPMNVLLKL